MSKKLYGGKNSMYIKERYRLYNRIALIISIILGVIVAVKFKGLYEEKYDIVSGTVGGIIGFFGIMALVLNGKKHDAALETMGILKVNGNNQWLGWDGNWHDGYNKIVKKKANDYYDKGGSDFGHFFNRYAYLFTLFISVCGLMMLSDYDFPKDIYIFSYMIVWMIYIVIRKVILG